MATYYFRNTGDANWGTASNWSLTDGGGATGSVPTSTDDAYFTSNSGSCTVNTSARNCKTLVFSGVGAGNYSGTFTMSQQLTVNGTALTLSATMTVSGSAVLVCNAGGTLTSNGKTWSAGLSLTGAFTYTFADNWTVSGTASLGSSSATTTLAGSFTLFCSGSTLTINNSNGEVTSSVTIVEVTGNTTFTSNGRFTVANFRINCGSNTFTHTQSGSIIGGSLATLTFTYVSGTVNCSSTSLFSVAGSVTWDTGPIIFNQMDFTTSDSSNTSKTFTFNSTMYIKGILRIGGGGTTVSGHTQNFAGSYGFSCGGLIMFVVNQGRTINFAAGVTYFIKNILTHACLIGNVNTTIQSSSARTKARFVIEKGCNYNLYGVNLIDIDNCGPSLIAVHPNGFTLSTISNSSGWQIVPVNQKYIPPSGNVVSY